MRPIVVFISALLLMLLLAFLLAGCKNDPPNPPGEVKRWAVLTHQSTPGLPSNKINGFAFDFSHRAWILTDSGASSVLASSWSTIQDSLQYIIQGVPCYEVAASDMEMDGSLWFGTVGAGISRFDPNGKHEIWKHYTYPDIAYAYVNCIATTRQFYDEVWVSTLFGVSCYVAGITDPSVGTWTTYKSPPLPALSARAIAVDPLTNDVVVGTHLGIALYDHNTWQTFKFPDPYNLPVSAMSFDLLHNVWIGKWEGVSRVNTKAWDVRNYTYENTGGKLPAGTIHAVANNWKGTCWFGTDEGIAQLCDTVWSRFTTANSPLPDNIITALAYDSFRQNLWIGTYNGVAIYNPNGVRF